MKKYIIKSGIVLCSIAGLLVLITAVTLNVLFTASKKKIALAVDTYFSQKISLESISYLLPNFIVVKNIVISRTLPADKDKSFTIQSVRTKFSFRELLMRRRFFITEVSVYNPSVNYSKFCSYLRNNLAQIAEFIRSLPKQDIKLSINAAVFDLLPKEGNRNYLTANFNLTIKNDAISGAGSISNDRQKVSSDDSWETANIIKGQPLEYNFKGFFTKDGVSIENLEFTMEDLYLKLWGVCNGNKLQCSGFAFKNMVFEERDTKEPVLTIIERIKFLLFGRRAIPMIIGLSRKNYNILDISCRARMSFPLIQIEQLNFFLNNVPYSLKGDVVLSDDVSLDLMISSLFAQASVIKGDDSKKIGLALQGVIHNGAFKGNSQFALEKQTQNSVPLEKLEVSLKDLFFYFYKYPQMKILAGQGDIACQTASNTYKLLLNDFSAIIRHQGKKFKFLAFRSLFYDGILEGRGHTDMSFDPARSVFNITVRDASAHKLDGILIHFSKLYGKLNSRMSFRSYPDMRLSGQMDMHKGYAEDFEFLKWLADFFALPSLKRIDFDGLSSDFSVDEKGAGLYGIALDSQQLNLRGDFSLHANNLVSSKLSLEISKPLLQESVKFTPLIKLLGDNFNSLSFNFQLSGILQAMNFQWLESDFKRKLQGSIPGFIERKIEKDVENAIDSISPQ